MSNLRWLRLNRSQLSLLPEEIDKFSKLVRVTIERFHVTSLPSRLRRKTENSRHVGVQQDRSFYGGLHGTSDMLIMLLMCVESDKIPSLHKLKQLYKHLPVGFLIDIAYTANNILYKLYTKMAVYF